MEWLHDRTVINGFVAATCVILVRAVWARRWTLRPASERVKLTERPITVSVMLQAIALTLMSPASSATAGRLLHKITGHWHIDTWIGHCLYICAAGLVTLNVKSRLYLDHDVIRARFRRHFELPLTVVVPLMLALLVVSPNADTHWADLYDSPTDHWLDAYWTLSCGMIAYLLVRAAQSLLGMRLDVRSRRTATAYLLACVGGITVCALQIVCAWGDQRYSHYFWAADCAVAILFANASAHSWRQKVRWFTPTR